MRLMTWRALSTSPFLEDINNILNTGEVPNLYAKDEIMQICEMVRNKAKKHGMDGSNAELFSFFIGECRTNLHMVRCRRLKPVFARTR